MKYCSLAPAQNGPRAQISHVVVASLLLTLSVCAVLMCFYSINTRYNGSLQVAHALIDDDRYDMVECGAAGQLQLKLDLSDQSRDHSIASTDAIRMCSANVLLFYQHKV